MDSPAVGAQRSVGQATMDVLLNVVIATVGVWLGLLVVGSPVRLSAGGALLVTVSLLLLETLLRPLLRVLAARGSVFLALILGVAAQIAVIAVVFNLVLGIYFEDWLKFLVVTAVAAVVIALGRWLVSASDAAYVIGHATRLRRIAPTGGLRPRGLVVVQIDGMSVDVLERAVRSGEVPTLARWLASGRHRLQPWWVPIPSTTPASQAALLYGDDRTIASFRWWDRATGQLLVSNRPADATVIEARLPAERGLLREGGVAVSTAFSGGADETYLVFSTALKRRGLGSGDVVVPVFASPFLWARTVVLTLGEMIKETFQARRQRRRRVQPRIDRKLSFVALRGLTNVALRTLNLVVVVTWMSRGAPIIFVDFVDYDEIAHHAGPERPEAMRALEGIDAVLAELEKVTARVATDYDIVVWSDHGQSLGSTFDQLTGQSLTDRIRELMDEPTAALESTNGDDWGPLNTLIAATVGRTKTHPESFVVGPDGHSATPKAEDVPDLVVVGGGNLGMVWFPQLPQRPTLTQVQERWPGLVPGLALTPGVGLVMVALGRGEALLVGSHGTRRIGGPMDGEVEGEDPMAPYDPRGLASLAHLSTLETCGDLVLLSTVDHLGLIHAFEYQVGSHGGLGGPQNRAVFIHPTRLPLDAEHDWADEGWVHGALPLHRQLENWRRHQGTLSDDEQTAATAPQAQA